MGHDKDHPKGKAKRDGQASAPEPATEVSPPQSIVDMEQWPPYPTKLERKVYDAELQLLQIELLKMQR